MIVYYDSETGNIKGMSYKIDPNRTENYFETDDPIAEKIFLGQEKSMRYCAVVRQGETKKGFIKLKSLSAIADQSITKRIIQFSKDINSAELTVVQDCTSKKISVKLLESSHVWWATDNQFSLKKLIIVACRENDPYSPLWHCSFTPEDLKNLVVDVPYTGTDNISFYTTRLFDSYRHEIKSSGN